MRFNENIDRNVHPDFLPRQYFRPIRQVLPYYLIGLILVLGALQLQQWLGSTAAMLAAFGLLSAAAMFVFIRLQQSNDLVMANDFQNMLFANAVSLGSRFCFFARHDGTIVYANDGTRKMFPNLYFDQSFAIDRIMEEAHVGKEYVSKLYSALSLGKRESLVFTMQTGEEGPQDFIIIIEPLQRPSGYFVIHGRPFKKEREFKPRLTGALGSTRLEKVEALLDELPVGVYLTNATGVIEYANPALELLARYDARRMVRDGVTIQKLIYHADGVETGEFDLMDFTGNVMVSCLNQSLSPAFLEQKKLRIEGEASSGYLGIVTPLG